MLNKDFLCFVYCNHILKYDVKKYMKKKKSHDIL